MAVGFKIDKKAVKALEKILTKDLKPGKINREMRSPMTQAGKLVVKKQKESVKGENKHVAKAIKQRSKSYKNGVVIRVIGPSVYGKGIKAGGETKPSGVVVSEAEKIEFGSRDQTARPFIRPSLESTASQTTRIIEKGYKSAIDKLTKSKKL